MLNETEVQELHELLGGAIEQVKRGGTPSLTDLDRARELVSVLVSDTALCVVELDDSASLRCPAAPADCSFLTRCYATGETYRRLDAFRLADEPRVELHRFFVGPDASFVEDESDEGYGRECALGLTHGRQIRCCPDPVEGFWVRIVAADGSEEVYWDEAEFADDPEVVLGALMGAAQNTVRIEQL
jgi:hypothetical protein